MSQIADPAALKRRQRKQPNGLPKLEHLSTKLLKLPNRALRIHSPQQESMLMSSIQTFGFLTPLVVGDDLTVIAGVLRLEAARKLGIERVPVLRASHLSHAQLEAFRIADNRIQEHGAWDERALQDALVEALANEVDLEALGFTIAAADIVLSRSCALPLEGEVVTPPATSLVRIGDVFRVGPHRAMCGDAFCAAHYVKLMGEQKAAMVFTDPPYNLAARSIGGKGRIKHRAFAAANGELPDSEFEEYLRSSTELLTAHAQAGALIYICIDWRSVRLLLNALHTLGLDLIDIAVWAKTGAGMNSFYRSQHEMIVVARVPGAKHRNNIEFGRHGRHRTNIWMYAGANVFGPMRDEALAMHPTVKPVELVMDAIKDCTKRGDVVLDSFGGSGSTLIAAQRVGRAARILEIDPAYVETILNRYLRVFGVEAVHEETGLTWADLIRHRSANADDPKAPGPHLRPSSTPNGE